MPWKLDVHVHVLIRAAYFHSRTQELTKLKAGTPMKAAGLPTSVRLLHTSTA